jgi:hypothetical protein
VVASWRSRGLAIQEAVHLCQQALPECDRIPSMMAFTMAIWANRGCVFHHILSAIRQRVDMMNLKKWLAVLVHKRRIISAAFTFSCGTPQNKSPHQRVTLECR